jgi:hypothetical protein
MEKGYSSFINCVDSNIFEKIIEEETAKGVWDTLKKIYGGDEKLKKVKLQALRKQYEMAQMNEGETVADFFSRLVSLTNQMKSCGKTISDLQKMEKVLRALTANFDYIVVAIEESKNLADMKLEELQASLEAHEMRLKQRTSEKVTGQALQAKLPRKEKMKQQSGIKAKKRGKRRTMLMLRARTQNQNDSSKTNTSSNKNSKKKVNMKEVQC